MRFEIHHHHHHHYPQLEEVLERLARMEKAQMSGASHMQTSLAGLKSGMDSLRQDVSTLKDGIAGVGALIRQEAGANAVLNDAANTIDTTVSALGDLHTTLQGGIQAIADLEASAAAEPTAEPATPPAETPAPIEPPTPPAPPPAETPLPPEPETPATPDAPADGATPPADPPA